MEPISISMICIYETYVLQTHASIIQRFERKKSPTKNSRSAIPIGVKGLCFSVTRTSTRNLVFQRDGHGHRFARDHVSL